jgi:hypothetical protein
MIPPMSYPEATNLHLAAAVKERVTVPVIAVGRLGSPARARQAVADGLTDLVAIGRQQIADPDWCRTVQAGKPVRRCLACNYCANMMLSGETISCVVNGRAGRETKLSLDAGPSGERIAIVGAGPAGLAYASLVAAANHVEVFERCPHPGGAFRYTGKAPLFGDVEAATDSFERHVYEMERRCAEDGVVFHYGVDPDGGRLAGFDRVVVATGAKYRFGLGAIAPRFLDAGGGKTRLARWMLSGKAARDWLYYRARRGTGDDVRMRVPTGPAVITIGDASRAGTAREAVASAFAAALTPQS